MDRRGRGGRWIGGAEGAGGWGQMDRRGRGGRWIGGTDGQEG